MAAGPLTVAVKPQGENLAPPIATGRLTFLDNNVDPGNGSVAAKAEFTNAGDTLWPGAIINVELPMGAAAPRIALPEAAVQTGRDAPFVWAIGAGGKIAMRDVTVAGRADGKVYLASGVQPGEQIVVDALSKLKPGDTVRTKAGGPGRPPRTANVQPVPPVGG
jgi:multidrug efflux system membrane fusion protein